MYHILIGLSNKMLIYFIYSRTLFVRIALRLVTVELDASQNAVSPVGCPDITL
jgi:hypothetical protein